MWTYHRIYDDVLIVLAEVALFRVATRDVSADRRTLGGLLLGLTALAMLCPGTLVEDPERSIWIFRSGHVVLWLVVLGFLIVRGADASTEGNEVNEGLADLAFVPFAIFCSIFTSAFGVRFSLARSYPAPCFFLLILRLSFNAQRLNGREEIATLRSLPH